MRMWHYYTLAAVPAALCLIATAASGMLAVERSTHVSIGLVGAICAVAVHTLLILFMIITGRVLKQAMRTRPLGPAFLEELNEFFSRRRAYPVALLGAVTVATTAVLGYGQRAFELSPSVHMLVGLFSLLFNLYALQEGYRTLRTNQGLVDRAAAELDRLDAERAARGEPAPVAPDDSTVSRRTAWVVFALSAWLPLVYWTVLLGERASIAFPLASGAACALALLRAWRTRPG